MFEYFDMKMDCTIKFEYKNDVWEEETVNYSFTLKLTQKQN